MKKSTIVLSLLAAFFANAQSVGNSPYATYGIGDEKYDNTVDITAMGGISTAYVNDFNNKFNFANPAANQNFGLTAINLEGTNENNYFKSDYNNINTKKHSSYLSNISIAFPISKKLKFGLGYQPYSSKAYTIVASETLSDNTTKYNRFTGSGTLSTVQGAVSYKISRDFSVGVRSNFYFGKISDTEEVSFSDAELINGFSTTTTIKSFNFTTGALYQKNLENDRKLTIGGTYTFGKVGKMKEYYLNSTYHYISTDEKSNETILEQKQTTANNIIPERASLGVGYGHDGKWFASTQFDFKKWQDIKFLGNPMQIKDSYRMSVGGWYLPNYNNFRNYFSRIIYRFGAYYERGGLKLNPLGANNGEGKYINEFAVTAGVTLPFSEMNINKMSSVDIALELGKRGTTQNNLINQTFFNLKVGLNFADLWFRKVEFD